MPRAPRFEVEHRPLRSCRARIYDCPMLNWLTASSFLATLIVGLAPVVPIVAQRVPPGSSIAAFRPKFESVLKQHGVVGGGFALVRGQGEAETLAFGNARSDIHRPVDDATAYNWASITKTMTAV